MDKNSKLLTILTEVDEGTKTPFKAHNEILFLFGVVKSFYCKYKDKDNCIDQCSICAFRQANTNVQ